MTDNDKPVLIYTTFPDQEKAEQLGGELVKSRLAACVNIIPGMVSLYVWEEQMQRDGEVVMLIKTRGSCAQAVLDWVADKHPYETPALLQIELSGGGADYLRWIADMTRPVG